MCNCFLNYHSTIIIKASFDNITNWLSEIERHGNDNMKKLLVGNKCDLTAERIVDPKKAKVCCNKEKKTNDLSLFLQKLADSLNIPYVETSAKNSTNVEQAFKAMIIEIIPSEASAESNKHTTINVSSQGKSAKNASGFCQSQSMPVN